MKEREGRTYTQFIPSISLVHVTSRSRKKTRMNESMATAKERKRMECKRTGPEYGCCSFLRFHLSVLFCLYS